MGHKIAEDVIDDILQHSGAHSGGGEGLNICWITVAVKENSLCWGRERNDLVRALRHLFKYCRLQNQM